MALKDTVKLMESDDYKDRFIAEYVQTKIRYEKLKNYNYRIEAYIQTDGKMHEPHHDCPYDILRSQQEAMGEYLHYLELRGIIEGIDLETAMDEYGR